LYYVTPILESSRALTRLFVPNALNTPVALNIEDFDYKYEVSPRVWLGIAGPDGWGFRTSYWHFDTDVAVPREGLNGANVGSTLISAAPLGVTITTPTILLAPLPGHDDHLETTTSLNTDVYDFEVTRQINCCCLCMLASAGARYAMIRQTYGAHISNEFNNPAVLSELIDLHSPCKFLGAGPTADLDATYPLGHSGFSLYGNFRGAVLIGHYEQEASASVTFTRANVATTTPLAVASFRRDAAVPEAEVELGVGWTGDMDRIKPFVRVGAVAMNYWDVLNNNNVIGTTPNPETLNGNLTFFGMTFTAGFSF
jgi:hypothetical protein